MRLIIDHREHDLIEKCQQILDINPNYTRVETDSLPIGDILMKRCSHYREKNFTRPSR